MVEMWPGGATAEEEVASESRLRLELARELHDRVSPLLTAMLVDMEHFKLEHEERQPVVARVSKYQDETREVINNLREVLSGLRGGRDLGSEFVEALRRDLVCRFVEETGIPVQVRVARSWPATLSRVAAIHLYRIIGEALSNVRRHSGARRASLTLFLRGDVAIITVRDQGTGLVWPGDDGERQAGSYGILGMRERALLLGGKLVVEPAKPCGTLVRLVVPRERLV